MSRQAFYWGVLGCAGVLVVVMGVTFFFHEKEVPEVILEDQSGDRFARIHPTEFFDEEFFWRHKEKDEERKYAFGIVRGAIIPHHLLPGEVISGTLQQLSSPEIYTVILIGPNHYERGKTPILTETASWDTPFGTLEGDIPKAKALLMHSFASEDFDVLQKEHSITGIVPYIRYYFPNAHIVPIVVSQKITQQESSDLVSLLSSQLKDVSVVVVAAVDFSHALVSNEAKKRNAESLQTMQDRSYSTLLSYGNDHVDSPKSIEVFLRTMDAVRANHLDVLYDTDSGRLTHNFNISVTSYFGLLNTVK